MTYPQALKDHLATGVTTLARCFAVTRRDGVVIGFTDHDRDLSFDGILFRADSGLTAKAIQQSTGLSVDNSEGLLRPGMTATATIAVTVVEDTMRVPSAALRFEPPQTAESGDSRGGSGLIGMIMPRRPSAASSEAKATDAPTVWVLRDGVATEVEVEAGASDGKLTAVRSDDLAEGDLVIIDQTTGG